MTIRPSILAPFLLTLTTAAACGPCADRRTPVPGPAGDVIIAADMCDGDGSGASETSGGSDSSGSTSAPTGTTDDGGASETSASSGTSGGDECPSVACDQSDDCPDSTFCQANECVLTCPCQADPGPCASKPFGGPVWFCPADAAPKCDG